MGIAADFTVRTGTAFIKAITPAGTGIHRCYQDEVRRIGQSSLDTGNMDDAVFQGLAQDFQDGPGKFRQFVEEEDAVMTESHFARFRNGPAADEAGCRNSVMGTAERAPMHELAVAEQAGDAVYLSHFQGFLFTHRRQNSRNPLGQHGLSAPGRPS